MVNNSNLRDVNIWRLKLGLLPVYMFGEESQDNRFVLLNGNRGNFCLDLTEDRLGSEARGRAWSSNVGHYVALVNDHVEVQRWDQTSQSAAQFSARSVLGDLERFHAYLEKDQPRSDLSVVSHAIRVFRSLRGALGKDVDGPTSLKAFLYLLACVTEGVDRGDIRLKKWGLDSKALSTANFVRDSLWEALADELRRERPVESLTPNLTLMLRHASGQVFQEAHYEAIFVSQQQFLFEGFAPAPVALGKRGKGIGLHFTPPALARTLVEEALSIREIPQNSLSIFDPACGSGEFLRETLRQLKIRGYKGKIKILGYDVSSAACDMARFVLAWEARGYEDQVTITIKRTDSLSGEEGWPRDVHLTIMNPPFVSWQDMEDEQRTKVQEILGPLSTKRPDLSSAFVWKATSSLGKRGVLASILPASFLDGTSTEPIRREMAETLSTRLVARLGSHMLFPAAMIDAALYIGAAGGDSREPAVAFWADYRPTSTSAGLRALRKIRYNLLQNVYPVTQEGYSIYLNPELNENTKSWAPRPYKSWQLFHSFDSLPKVKDIFDVKQGALTGLNTAFILSKEDLQHLPKKERAYFRLAVLNKSIKYGYLLDSFYVFYPYGEFAIDSEEELEKSVGMFYREVLLPNKKKLVKRELLNPSKWWELTRHRTWQVAPTPKLVSTYFGDAGSFAWDSAGDFVVVQGYGWVLKPAKKMAYITEELGLAYLAILNSSLFSELLSAASNHVGGGQWNLSKRFVNEIAMPNLLDRKFDPTFIRDLSAMGSRIHAGQAVDDSKLETLVNLAYRT